MVLNALIALFVIAAPHIHQESNMEFTYDPSGLIVNYQDGGDTSGREGGYWFYAGLTKQLPDPYRQLNFEQVLEKLQVSPGVFVRDPNQPSYDIPSDFSRDQALPLMLAMGANGRFREYNAFLTKLKANWFKFPNGDLAGPELISIVIRDYNRWYLYPFLFVGDLFTLGESLIRCFASRNDTSDDINHTLILLQSQYKYPTPFAWFARKVYKWLRPGGVQAAWDSYFAPKVNSDAFNTLFAPLIEKM
jgi:hypothetical protein